MTVDLFIFHFNIREGRAGCRIPVNNIFAAIDQALFIELDEYLAHRLGQPLIQSKALA
ncbi:hypothetical protein D3C76_1809150 [compost metagenome]